MPTLIPVGTRVTIKTINDDNPFAEFNEHIVGQSGTVVQHSGFGSLGGYSQSNNSNWDIEVEIDKPLTLSDKDDVDAGALEIKLIRLTLDDVEESTPD